MTEAVQVELFAAKSQDNRSFRFALTAQINRASHTGWTTTGHTAADVSVLAMANSGMILLVFRIIPISPAN